MTTASAIVWVLLVHGHGPSLTPTLEFKTSEKCEAAATVVKSTLDNNTPALFGRDSRKPLCVRIEK